MPLDYFAKLFHRPLDRDLVLPWYDAGRFLAAPLADGDGLAQDAGLSSGPGAMGPHEAALEWNSDRAAGNDENARHMSAVDGAIAAANPSDLGDSARAGADMPVLLRHDALVLNATPVAHTVGNPYLDSVSALTPSDQFDTGALISAATKAAFRDVALPQFENAAEDVPATAARAITPVAAPVAQVEHVALASAAPAQLSVAPTASLPSGVNAQLLSDAAWLADQSYNRAPRFLSVFSAAPRCERFEVGRGLLTGGLVGGFVAVVQCLRLDPCRLAA